MSKHNRYKLYLKKLAHRKLRRTKSIVMTKGNSYKKNFDLPWELY